MNETPASLPLWRYVVWSVAIVVLTVAVLYWFECKISG